MQLALYFVLIHVTLLIPGYVFIHYLKLFRSHPAVSICLGYLSSIVFAALLATLYYVCKLPVVVVQLVYWIAFATSIFFLFKSRLYVELLRNWIPIAAFVVMSGFTLCFTFLTFTGPYTVIPDPTPQSTSHYDTLSVKVLNLAHSNANDNYIPYRQAQFFVNRLNPATDSFISEWGVHFFERTPLMGAVTANYFLTLHDYPPTAYTWSKDATDPDHTYVKFQIIAQILNCLFIVPGFFLIRRIFNLKSALISLLFLIPSQFFLANAFFTWPKSMVAFFILSSWYFLVIDKRLRFVWIAAIASGLAYLTHDLAILYIGATFIFLLFNRRVRDAFIVGLGSGVFAAPWLFTASVLFHKPSSFIYYPISTKDIPQPDQLQQIKATFFHTSPLRLIGIRLQSLAFLLSPYQLLVNESNQDVVRRIWASGIFSIPGALGFGLVIPAIVGFFKKNRIFGVLLLVFLPVIFCVIVIGWPMGLGALHFAEALIVLLTGLAAFALTKAKRVLWTYLALLVNTIQLIILILFSYNFDIAATPRNIVLGGIMILVVLGSFVGVHFVSKYIAVPKK